jgi:hypothetical protein
MKKLIIPFVALFVVAVTLISWRSHTAAKAAAVHISDAGCGLLDGDGFFAVAASDATVITSSGNGKLTCKASGLANSTGKAVKYDNASTGALCNVVGAGATDDWQEIVSASGQATLQCRVHP